MLAGFAWVELYVRDLERWRRWFEKIGFTAVGQREAEGSRSYALGEGSLTLVITGAMAAHSPVADYLQRHPEGVIDVALGVTDWQRLTERLAVSGCEQIESLPGTVRIRTPVGVTHTFVQGLPELPPDFVPLGTRRAEHFGGIDHVTLNVPVSAFEETWGWYSRVLGLERERFFEIATPHSALQSYVLANAERTVRLPLNAPVGSGSQIQEFLDANRGAGVQHVALGTRDIFRAVDGLRAAGVRFLDAPEAYYEALPRRFDGLEREHLRDRRILFDRDETGNWLMQIFTEPIFTEPTLFFELIERRGDAQGFGEGNFQALFEAIEAEQHRRAFLG